MRYAHLCALIWLKRNLFKAAQLLYGLENAALGRGDVELHDLAATAFSRIGHSAAYLRPFLVDIHAHVAPGKARIG